MDIEYELYAPSYRLPCVSKRITFGVGHILNDLSSTVYYNFILLYLINVAKLVPAYVGYIVLFGQVVSAVASVAADHLGQYRNALCCCYTRRKSWHIIGSFLVIVGFLLLFMHCIGCSHVKEVYRALYYGAFILLFQLGWSFVQSSHLGLIPEMTRNQHERIELNAIRYTVSLVGQIVIFAVTWLIFSLTKGDTIGPDDHMWFRTLAIVVVATGFVAAAVFHIGTDETGYDLFLETHLSTASFERMTGRQWLKQPQYYKILFLHMFTRLSAGVAIMYLPLFVSQTLLMHKVYLAVLPFAALLGSIFVPFAIRPLARCTTPKFTYVIGASLVMGVAVWTWFIKMSWPVFELQVFALVVILGAGGAITTLSSLTMAQTLVGDRTESGSFVFRSMSVADKLITGVAILVIQQLNKCPMNSSCENTYYHYVFTGVVGGAVAAGFLVLITLVGTRIGRLRNTAEAIGTPSNTKNGESDQSDEHMNYFEVTPSEDCFNYWSCLSTSREAEAHGVAVVFSSPYSMNLRMPSVSSGHSINSPYAIPNVDGINRGRRSHSYESIHSLTNSGGGGGGIHPSSSAPSIIEYSGNHEKHHKSKNSRRRAPLKVVDTAGLIDNEQPPGMSNGLPGAAAAAAAAANGDSSREKKAESDVVADVHPAPQNGTGEAGETGEVTPPDLPGTPYDNVQVTVTPGGKIIDPETAKDS